MTIFLKNKELLAKFRAGDPSAMATVYREYGPPLMMYLKGGFSFYSKENKIFIKGITEPWQLENAMQEVFTRAFSKTARNGYDGLRPYKSYIFTIAKNYLVEVARKDKRLVISDDITSQLSSENKGENLPQYASYSPEEVVSDKQLMDLVENFVTQMDSKQKELFEVRFVQGNSIEKTALEIGTTEYWVKREEKKIKQQFYKEMTDKGYFEGFKGTLNSRRVQHCMLLLIAAYQAMRPV